MSGFDFNFGAGNNVTPYNFGGTNYGGYSPLSQFGMPAPTGGANTGTSPVLGNTLEDGVGTPGGTSGLGLNIPTLQLGLQGLGSIANLYTGLKALGLAKDQFAFQKDMASKNYTNSVASYNTQLSDRANARAAAENQSPASAQAYINANKLA